MASSKKRHYLYILKDADVIKRDLEKNHLTDTDDYKQICTMWDVAFVELLRTKMPFFHLAEDDVVRIAIDEKFFDMSCERLCDFIGETSFVELMNTTDFKNIDEEDKADDEESMAFASEFEKLKNKILGSARNSSAKPVKEVSEPQTVSNYEPKTVVENETGIIPVAHGEVISTKTYREETYAVNTTEIAFIGLEPGIGTTYTAIMCAMALSKQYKVAYFEHNDTGHVEALAEWLLEADASSMNKIELGSVDYFFNMDYMTFIANEKEHYDFVIINYGNMQEHNHFKEFFRSGKRFVVASGIDWHLGLLKEFYKECEYDRTNSLTYLIPVASNEMVQTVKGIITKNEVVGIPYCENPFEPTGAEEKLFSMLHINKEETPIGKPEKKKFHFGLKS